MNRYFYSSTSHLLLPLSSPKFLESLLTLFFLSHFTPKTSTNLVGYVFKIYPESDNLSPPLLLLAWPKSPSSPTWFTAVTSQLVFASVLTLKHSLLNLKTDNIIPLCHILQLASLLTQSKTQKSLKSACQPLSFSSLTMFCLLSVLQVLCPDEHAPTAGLLLFVQPLRFQLVRLSKII